VRQRVRDLWAAQVFWGRWCGQQQAQSAVLAPVVEEVRAAVQRADVANIDETGWREDKQRAWLWTVVTARLTTCRIDRSRGGEAVEVLLGRAARLVVLL
jgi:transposase